MKSARYMLMMLVCCVAMGMQAQQREHVVQRGEDFASIAKKYAITEQELMDANPASKACYVGRKLIIPQHGVPVERKAVEAEPLDIKLLSDDKDILTKSSATTYQVGQALWRKGKYDEAVSYLTKAVDAGEPRAYYPLGECYAQKDAKCHDDGKAAECFMKASEKVKSKYDESYWHSCGNLAKSYQSGNGVKKDLAKAKHYTNEYQLYTDPDGREDASKLMRGILAEERAIAEKELAEKRAIAMRKLQEKRERERQVAEKMMAQQGSKQGKALASANKAKANNNTSKSQAKASQYANTSKSQAKGRTGKSDEELFPGYTRRAPGMPQVGETKYWHQSGTCGLCSLRCFQSSDGTVLYAVSPDPHFMDFGNMTYGYRQNGQRNGWIVLQRVKSVTSMNMSIMNIYNPFLTDLSKPLTFTLVDVAGEVYVTPDGSRVKLDDGKEYGTPVDENTANIIKKELDRQVARAVGMGIIKYDNSPSEVEQQLKADIEEIDRRQAERRQKEMNTYQMRDELNRGHRTTRYKYTNVESTPTVWCDVCNRFAKPHTHPINDGRH